MVLNTEIKRKLLSLLNIMFKTILASLATLGLLAGPVAAQPASQERIDAHGAVLAAVVENTGLNVFINDPYCQKVPAMGMYTANDNGEGMLLICQDNHTEPDKIVEWTENDLDTIRHELIHYIQDCKNGAIDVDLEPLHADVTEVMDAMGPEFAYQVFNLYQRGSNADANTIRVELEAFYYAQELSIETIGQNVQAYCGI